MYYNGLTVNSAWYIRQFGYASSTSFAPSRSSEAIFFSNLSLELLVNHIIDVDELSYKGCSVGHVRFYVLVQNLLLAVFSCGYRLHLGLGTQLA